MEHYLKQLVLWTYFHPHWAGVVIFLIAFAESVPVIGTIIPGSIVMTAIGTLIGANILPFYSTLVWASIGAFAGDSAGFITGYLLKERLNEVWPFRKRKQWLEKGQIFFKKHGKKSIFIARFIGPIRAFMPITAGAMQMKPSQFYPTDFFSAILWAFLYMLPGILIGTFSLDLPPDIALHFIWWLLLALAGIVIVSWLIRIISLHISDVLNDSLNHTWQRWRSAPKLNSITTLLKHHNPSHPRGQLGHFLCLLLFAFAFLYLAYHIAHYGSMNSYNSSVYHFFRSLRNLPTDKIMLGITFFGDKRLLLIPTASALAWLIYKRCWRAATHWAALVFVSYGAVGVLKPIVHSARPTGLAVPLSHFSFPSGHSTLSTAIFGFVAFLIATRWPPRVRWKCYTIALTGAVLVVISRLYLGAHWLTDTIGGMLLGITCVLVIILSYQREEAQRIQPFGFLFSFLAGLALSFAIYAHKHFEPQLANYQPVWSQKTIALDAWWKSNGKAYPMFQVNRFGQAINVLNIQWAGDIETITKTLEENAWHKPIPFSWVTAIQHPELSHKYSLHIKTALFRDRKPSIILMKPIDNNKTLLLRLWGTGIQFKQSPKLLWAGTLTIHTDSKHKITEKDYQKLNEHTLVQALSKIPNFQVQTKAIELEDKKLFRTSTHGSLILIKPKENKN